MQITAFKAILARRINIRGCEDYKNTFARMESDCTLRFGFKAVINSISYTDVTKTGNGERRTGVWERVYSGNPPENSKWRRKQCLQTLILSLGRHLQCN